jgi:hypothetical protein
MPETFGFIEPATSTSRLLLLVYSLQWPRTQKLRGEVIPCQLQLYSGLPDVDAAPSAALLPLVVLPDTLTRLSPVPAADLPGEA